MTLESRGRGADVQAEAPLDSLHLDQVAVADTGRERARAATAASSSIRCRRSRGTSAQGAWPLPPQAAQRSTSSRRRVGRLGHLAQSSRCRGSARTRPPARPAGRRRRDNPCTRATPRIRPASTRRDPPRTTRGSARSAAPQAPAARPGGAGPRTRAGRRGSASSDARAPRRPRRPRGSCPPRAAGGNIRMEASGEAAKSPLDLDAARISAYAEDLVVVLLEPHRRLKKTLREAESGSASGSCICVRLICGVVGILAAAAARRLTRASLSDLAACCRVPPLPTGATLPAPTPPTAAGAAPTVPAPTVPTPSRPDADRAARHARAPPPRAAPHAAARSRRRSNAPPGGDRRARRRPRRAGATAAPPERTARAAAPRASPHPRRTSGSRTPGASSSPSASSHPSAGRSASFRLAARRGANILQASRPD